MHIKFNKIIYDNIGLLTSQIKYMLNLKNIGFYQEYIGPSRHEIHTYEDFIMEIEMCKWIGLISEYPYDILLDNIHRQIMQVIRYLKLSYSNHSYEISNEDWCNIIYLKLSEIPNYKKYIKEEIENQYYINTWSDNLYLYFDYEELKKTNLSKQTLLFEQLYEMIKNLDEESICKLTTYLEKYMLE